MTQQQKQHQHYAVISRSAGMAVRRALNAFLHGWVLDDRLRGAARMIAGDARRHGLRAEQMLVALKREWPALTRVRSLPEPETVRAFAERLTTHCIHEFYACAADR